MRNLAPMKEDSQGTVFPRYIRVYDNQGETFDRYTIVFTLKKVDGSFQNIGASGDSMNSYYQRGYSRDQIDTPTYSHLGKKISFLDLPETLQTKVLEDYNFWWNL